MASYSNNDNALYSGSAYEGNSQQSFAHIYGGQDNHNGLRRRNVVMAAKQEPTKLAIPKEKNFVKRLDFMFPKVDQEYRVQTEKGGLTTMIAVAIVAVLTLGEIASWMYQNNATKEHIAVNTDLNKKMRINLNITFPALACEDLHVDAMDVAGDSQMDIEDTLVKIQLRKDGSVRSAEEIKVETNKHRQEQDKKEKILKEKLPENYCGSCFGAHEDDDQCCQTCDELLDAYKKKRWKSNMLMYTAEQCIREGRDHEEPKKMRKGQGCNLSGYMTVNRVAGNFHVAMGKGIERDGRHIHSFLPEDTPNFNASHIIHQLSFGPGEEGKAAMNGMKKIVGPEHGTTGLFQYFIKIVPTTYVGDQIPEGAQNLQVMPSLYEEVENNVDKREVLETNRYFFTERFRPLMQDFIEEENISDDDEVDTVTVGAAHKGGHANDQHHHHHARNSVLPGVFFIYEIYPFAVEISSNRVSLTHLFIRLIAIIGGVFTFAGWLDFVLNRDDKVFKERSILSGI